MKRNINIIIIGVIFLFFLIGGFCGWSYFCSRYYHATDVRFFSGDSERLVIPPRPGTLGVLIDLPQENPMFFGIDVLQSDPVDWEYLNRLDPRTDVRIRGFIDFNGELIIQNVIDVTHAGAGDYLKSILSTWRYTPPVRTGEIMFHFNLPSEGHKLIVYTGGLKRNPNVDKKLPIFNARLYYVKGVDSHLVLLRE